MYSVNLYSWLCRECHIEETSMSVVARRVGINRKTVAKMLGHAVSQGHPRRFDPFCSWIDSGVKQSRKPPQFPNEIACSCPPFRTSLFYVPPILWRISVRQFAALFVKACQCENLRFGFHSRTNRFAFFNVARFIEATRKQAPPSEISIRPISFGKVLT